MWQRTRPLACLRSTFRVLRTALQGPRTQAHRRGLQARRVHRHQSRFSIGVKQGGTKKKTTKRATKTALKTKAKTPASPTSNWRRSTVAARRLLAGGSRNVSMEALAMGRVNSFVTGEGKARQADADLLSLNPGQSQAKTKNPGPQESESNGSYQSP